MLAGLHLGERGVEIRRRGGSPLPPRTAHRCRVWLMTADRQIGIRVVPKAVPGRALYAQHQLQAKAAGIGVDCDPRGAHQSEPLAGDRAPSGCQRWSELQLRWMRRGQGQSDHRLSRLLSAAGPEVREGVQSGEAAIEPGITDQCRKTIHALQQHPSRTLCLRWHYSGIAGVG